MANRTTEEYVREIAETNPDTSLVRFIEMANSLTNRVNTCATSKGYTLTDDELIQIESLLAAHFYSLMDQRYKSKSTERASASFDTLSYLDQAKLLDPSGCLAAMMAGNRASLKWLGTSYTNTSESV